MMKVNITATTPRPTRIVLSMPPSMVFAFTLEIGIGVVKRVAA